MIVDDAGLIWITNLWLAVGFLLIALGLTLFSHGWIATGRAPRPRQMAVRMRRRRPGAASSARSAPVAMGPTPLAGWRSAAGTPRRGGSHRARRLVA